MPVYDIHVYINMNGLYVYLYLKKILHIYMFLIQILFACVLVSLTYH